MAIRTSQSHARAVSSARVVAPRAPATRGRDVAVDGLQRVFEASAAAYRTLHADARARLLEASNVDILTTLATRAAESEADRLGLATVRGLDVRSKLVALAGGLLDGKTVASHLRLTPAAVHKRFQKAQLLGVREGNRIAYPALQFQATGEAVRGLPEVLRVLAEAEVDGWSQLRFLAGPSSRLGGRKPMAALGEGDLDAVLSAARAVGEHGAA